MGTRLLEKQKDNSQPHGSSNGTQGDASESGWHQPSDSAEGPGVWHGFQSLWTNRNLISLMVQRDFVGRYKGSLLGTLWPLVNPLGHMLLYTFLFSVILQVRFGNDPSTSNFAICLMTGLLPYTVFSEALARSTTVILESPNLVTRVVFPLEILPLVLTISSLFSASVSFLLVVGAVLIYSGHINVTVCFVPLILLSQIVLTAGITWLLASIGVFIRDLSHIISLILAAWMYATPIVYPASKMPANFKFLLQINPLAGIVTDYRRVILEGVQPDWASYACYTAIAVIAFVVGFCFFYKTKKSFADVM